MQNNNSHINFLVLTFPLEEQLSIKSCLEAHIAASSQFGALLADATGDKRGHNARPLYKKTKRCPTISQIDIKYCGH